jgi:hypothetical protein
VFETYLDKRQFGRQHETSIPAPLALIVKQLDEVRSADTSDAAGQGNMYEKMQAKFTKSQQLRSFYYYRQGVD